MACCVAQGFDQIGNFFQLPSSWLLGQSQESPIITTKYIFASHYTIHNQHSAPLAKRVKEIQCQETMRLAARVFWAVSIVLPVLDFIGAFFKELAAFDPVMYRQYKDEQDMAKLQRQANEVRSFGNAVREFAVVLATIGCKKEVDEGVDKRVLLQQKRDKLANFSRHFKDRDSLNAAIGQSSECVLTLLEKAHGLSGRVLEIKENDDNTQDLYANIGHCFMRAKLAAEQKSAPEYLLGEEGGPFYREWNYLVSRKERIAALCEGIAATYENGPKAGVGLV
jgi:hypothetical protein